LGRKQTLELKAVRALVRFIRKNEIRVLHAHGTSVAMAGLASLFSPWPVVVWHDHYGRNVEQERSVWLYRMMLSRVWGVLAVSQSLADWSRTRLGMAADRVWYMPNFLAERPALGGIDPLPGSPGQRIVCVANLRPVKDHPTLLKAMQRVVHYAPDAHLLLVGADDDQAHAERLKQMIVELQLTGHVSLLGRRDDVTDILQAADIGVLSSQFEGFPLSLLEYGAAGLPVVATRVGQTPEVLDEGAAGILTPKQTDTALSEALLTLLQSPQLREMYGERLRQRVRQRYSSQAIIGRVVEIYDQALDGRGAR
jgi:glycosyltransferase involved in cell wall biosynthesis